MVEPVTTDVQRELADVLLGRFPATLGEVGSELAAAALLPTVQALIADAEKRAAAGVSCPTCVREGPPYRCCPHCVEDPDYHTDGRRNHHDLPCTLCLRFPQDPT